MAEHGEDPEDVGTAASRDGEPDPGRDRALGEIARHHEQPGLPPHEPGDVRGPGIAGAFGEDVVAAGPGHEEGGREGAEEIRRDREEPELGGVVHGFGATERCGHGCTPLFNAIGSVG